MWNVGIALDRTGKYSAFEGNIIVNANNFLTAGVNFLCAIGKRED